MRADLISPGYVEPISILYLVNNRSQFQLILGALNKSKHLNYIYFSQFDERDDYWLPDNVRIIKNSDSALMIMSKFSGIVTSVGHFSPVLSNEFKAMLFAAAAMRTPIIEVPHGLFEWGFNFVDDSQIVDFASFRFGCGGRVPTFADLQISWFGESGVGYPLFSYLDSIEKETPNVPDYIVVTTNTNWFMYNEADQRLLYLELFRYCELHSDKLFIWCPHPAELSDEGMAHYLLNMRPRNLLHYGLDNDIYFYGIDSTEQVIKYAQRGISTVSTCLLAFEAYGVPVSIFSVEGMSVIEKSLTNANFFDGIDERLVDEKFKLLTTGYLKPFDHKNFFSLLEKGLLLSKNSQPLKSKHILSAFVNTCSLSDEKS